MSEPTGIRYEIAAPRVARITLDRPQVRNAQDTRLLYALNDAYDRAAQDDDVRVIVLAAEGEHFSAGHDLREFREADPREWDVAGTMGRHRTVGTWCGFGCEGAEGVMAREREIYLGFCERWRTIPKPTIAEVRGMVIAGGLMLVWPCDLVVASDDAAFVDNTLAMGVAGVEYFQHPWEVGARKAKEMLFTSDVLSAADAHRLGMVNHVVPGEELTSFTMRLAARIAEKPSFALKLSKEAVNHAQDASGRTAAMHSAFVAHQLCHSHNMQLHGKLIDPSFSLSRARRSGKRVDKQG